MIDKIISFDGLNRSGKGTQIKLLRDYLDSRNILVEVLRGDGSRPGIDSRDFYDPHSNWWINWQAKCNKTVNDWNIAYHILSEENDRRYKEFSIENQKRTLLMDRSYISRYFMLKQQGIKISLEEVVDGIYIIPEHYFVLEVSKETLLERASEDNLDKTEFRRDVIRKWYDLWTEVVYDAQEFLKRRLIIINGLESPHNIHEYVINKLGEK